MDEEKNLGEAASIELSDAYSKVLYWLLDFPDKEFGLTEISEAVGISKTNANKIITALRDEGFLTIEDLGRLWRIKCNTSHPYNLTRKVPYHLTLIYESGVIDHLIKSIPGSKAIILFGSYRKGDDNSKSDIDLAVEISGEEEEGHFNIGFLQTLGYRTNVRVNATVFSRKSIDINLFNNIANGIVLHGFLEVKK